MSEQLIVLSCAERLLQGDVILARDVVDRESIELQAAELINLHVLNKYEIMSGEADNNAITSLFEEMTAAGDLSEIRFAGDQRAVHRAALDRWLNGYNENMPYWDKRRFFAEICEELTLFSVFIKIEAGELPENTILITNSDFPTDATTLLEAHGRGYRAGNRKGMSRALYFETDGSGGYVRVLEQISRSNSHDNSTRDWFNQNASAVPLHATGALNEQLLATRQRLPDGVVTFAKELDDTLTYKARYGEPIMQAIKNGRPDYDEVRQVSLERRNRLMYFINELSEEEARLKILLHDGSINYPQKLAMFHVKQTEIVDRILLLNTNYARDARGDLSAKYYEMAARAFEEGNYNEAASHLESAHHAKDPLAGGSCGGSGQIAEEIINRAKEDKKKLKLMNCPHCKSLVYDDPCAKFLACWGCKAMVINGQTISKGNSGEKKHLAELTLQRRIARAERAKNNTNQITSRQVGNLALS